MSLLYMYMYNVYVYACAHKYICMCMHVYIITSSLCCISEYMVHTAEQYYVVTENIYMMVYYC